MSTAAAPAALRLLQLEAEIRRLEDETALLHHLAGKARIHLAEINIIFHQMIDVTMQKAVSP